MALKVRINLSETWYTPDGQGDDPEPTRFKVRPLNGQEFNNISTLIKRGDGIFEILGDGITQILGYALLDWENVFDEKDRKVPFSSANHKFLPWYLRNEIATKIFMDSMILEDTEKN